MNCQSRSRNTRNDNVMYFEQLRVRIHHEPRTQNDRHRYEDASYTILITYLCLFAYRFDMR